MNNISGFDHCYGCGVCATACPKNAISMYLNKYGFYQPSVDKNACIDCGICLDVCAFNHDEVCQNQLEPQCAAAWSNNKDTRFNCTSGGTAFEIARIAIEKGYKVCGVRYDIIRKSAHHFIAENEEQLRETVGSKYIQSQTTSAFSQFKNGEKYFVVGTPCQIDSIRRWIRKRKWEDNFILMDFFCHSVPSLLMWHKYLEHTGIKTPDIVQFRNKRNGWQDSTTVCINGDGREWFSPHSKGDLFFMFFLGDRCPNQCCVEDCKYKQRNSAADLRIGDLWGYKYIDNKDGVNALVAFTSKGKEIMSVLSDSCTLEACDFTTVSELQMKSNCIPKRSYSYVLNALKTEMKIDEIYRHAKWIELPDTIKSKIKYYWHRLLPKIDLQK